MKKAFLTKVVQEKEKKLKEFNFKLLHSILLCNKNLMKWKIRLNSVCDVCDETQTIVHLLYDGYYVKLLWKVIDNVYKTKVTFKQILGLDELFDHSAVTTIMCFLIYKEWLLLSLENRKRKSVRALDFFTNEINLRVQIYEKCMCIDLIHRPIDRMKELVLHL